MVSSHRSSAFKWGLSLYLGVGLVALAVAASELAESEAGAGAGAGSGAHTKNPMEQVGSDIMSLLNSVGGSRGGAQASESGYDSPSSTSGYDQAGTEQYEQDSSKKNPMDNMGDYAKLINNPSALVKRISKDFKIPLDKLVDKVGKGLITGSEAMFSPVISGVKIIEKVFKPDTCRLKYICQFGTRLDFMRETMLRFSPNLFEGSTHLTALSYGIIGRDCAQVYEDCEPTLKKPYEELKQSDSSESGKEY